MSCSSLERVGRTTIKAIVEKPALLYEYLHCISLAKETKQIQYMAFIVMIGGNMESRLTIGPFTN